MQDSNVVYQQTTTYVLTEVEHDLVMRSEEDYKAYNRQNQKYSFSKRKVQKIEGLETPV